MSLHHDSVTHAPDKVAHASDQLAHARKLLAHGGQFTRKDLDIDQDSLEDPNMSYEFLTVPPTKVRGALDGLSSTGSSGSSSTVVRAQGSGEDDTKLQGITLGTLETDAMFTGKLRSAMASARANERDANEQKVKDHTSANGANARERSAGQRSAGKNSAGDNNATVPTITTDATDDCEPVSLPTDDFLPSPPSSPPRELDPSKLYALYDFNGPDSSHIELLKDDSVELLNDTDSYWWLVRRMRDGRVGFAPAEILETYKERLARLNCWKNEVLERGKEQSHLSREDLKLFEYTPLTSASEIGDVGKTGMAAQEKTGLGAQTQSAHALTTQAQSPSARVRSVESLHHKSSLRRKSSLRKGGRVGAVKKSVTFVRSLPNLPEEKRGEVSGEEARRKERERKEEERIPLVVPKRACRTNFLIHDLDAYNRRHPSADALEAGPPSPAFTAGSIGSYSPSTDSESDGEWEWKEPGKASPKESTGKEPAQKQSKLAQVRNNVPARRVVGVRIGVKPPTRRRNATVSAGSGSAYTKTHRIASDVDSTVSANSGDGASAGVAGAGVTSAGSNGADIVSAGAPVRPTHARVSSCPGGSGIPLSQSLRMLDDLIQNSPEFNHSRRAMRRFGQEDSAGEDEDDDDNEIEEKQKATEPMGSGSRDKAGEVPGDEAGKPSEEDQLDMKKLHPVTSEIFHPLIDHMEQVEKMLKDITIGG